MDHVHFLNHKGSYKKAGKESVAEVKFQALEEFMEKTWRLASPVHIVE